MAKKIKRKKAAVLLEEEIARQHAEAAATPEADADSEAAASKAASEVTVPEAADGAPAEGTPGRLEETPTGEPTVPIAEARTSKPKAPKASKTKRSQSKPAKATKASKPAKSSPARMSALDAAAKVLGETGEPMSTGDMIEAMSIKKYWTSPNGATPAATLYSAILREINTKGKESRFKKTGKGKFAVKA